MNSITLYYYLFFFKFIISYYNSVNKRNKELLTTITEHHSITPAKRNTDIKIITHLNILKHLHCCINNNIPPSSKWHLNILLYSYSSNNNL